MRRVSSTLIPRTKRIFPRECPLFSCSLPCFSFCFSFCFLPPPTHPAATHTSRKPLGLAPRYHLSPSPSVIAFSYRLQSSPSGSILGFPSPSTPFCTHPKPFPGAKSPFLSQSASPEATAGAKSAFPIPFAPLRPLLKALPGSRSPFLIHCALPAGLPGSILGFSIPFAPLQPLLKPLSGSKPAFLSPQTLSGAACSCCRSGAGEAYTGAPPQTPAPLKPFPTLLRKVTGRGGPHPRTCSIIYSL